MRRKVHFPACGFGFWYLLGILVRNKKRLKRCIVSGTSSGTLICALTLTNQDDLYNKLMDVATECKFTNLHDIFVYTLDSIFSLVEDTERTRRKLRHICIVVTKIQSDFPFVKREVITPTSLSELRELCIASAYIPFISNYQNKLYYSIGDSYYIDGAFTELHEMHDIQIPSEFYGVNPPSAEICKQMYNQGFLFSS
jgi:hypothetical protein